MPRHTLLVLATFSVALIPALVGQDIIDDFSGKDWSASNPKAPATVEVRDGILVLTDHPGGEVTWGSSCAKRFAEVDLEATPYLVFRVQAVTGGFGCKLAGGADRPKRMVASGSAAGLVVIDIVKATKWPVGAGPLVVMLYTNGDGTQATYGPLRFTGTLTADEKAALTAETNTKLALQAPKYAGLTALAARTGAKPKLIDPKTGERSVYRDPVTGHMVWRMTDDPAVERHVYYDTPAWNANGSILHWVSRRDGGRYWLMDADGTNLRTVPKAADGGPVHAPHWSTVDPHRMYFARAADEETTIYALDVRDGTVVKVVSIPMPVAIGERRFTEFAPPHPDDHHFLLRWGGQDRHPSLIVVVDSETGEFTKLEAGTPTHRMRFTKAPDWSVFINSNQDPDRPGVTARVEYVLSLDGTRRRLPPIGGHPDWSPDGKWAAGYKDDGIWLVSHDGTARREVLHNGAGRHGGFSIATGRWHVGDSPSRGPYADLVYVTEFATGIAIPIAYHGSSYSGWGSGVPDPEATHPAPICSPDETKIVYDSDLLGQPDMWVAVWQRPEAPQDVQFANGSLRWKAPVKHRETAGYVVYRKSDGNWSPVTGLVAGTSMDGLADGTYAVAAREWSGLESGLAMANTNVLVPDCLAPMRPEAPAVIETGETYTVLELPATKEKAFNHYNVYASPDAGTAPSNATLVGSPSDRRFVDWGFETGSARHYRVTVVDSQGNESLPSVASGGETGGDGFGKLRTTTAADGSLHADLPVGSGALRQGTLTMEIQTSRRIGHTARGLATGNLVRSPGIRVSLQETGSGPRFLVQPPGETRKPTAACLFAWLAPEQWYHLAVSWNAETGDVDLFVNGWAQQRLRLPPWKPAEGGGDITLGGLLGKGDDAATIRVRNPELQAWAMDEARLRRSLLGRTFASAGDGVRQGREEPLDLTGLKLTPIFEPDFRKPLPVVHEDDLCKGEQRVREPKPGQWVLEGPASASTKDGELVIDNLATDGTAHTVLWLPEAFPADLLVEYDITIEQPDEGLAILFCAARPAGDPTGSIFKPGLPRRNGVFQSYIKGDIDSYHVSYLSAGERDSAIPGPRRAANVRKNSGFWLVACGDDQIQGRGYGRVPHHVRLLKVGNRLQVEVNGKLSVNFDDDGKTWGPVWGDGYVGLRQMNHLLSARYSGLRVYRVGKE